MSMHWRGLSGQEWRALLAAGWRLLAVRLAMAILGVAATQRRLAHRVPAGNAVLSDPDPWQHRVVALSRIARRLPDTRCLARSLTLWWWMRAKGLNPHWHLGVRAGEEKVEGHAWVECDGFLFDETVEGAASFTPLQWPRER